MDTTFWFADGAFLFSDGEKIEVPGWLEVRRCDFATHGPESESWVVYKLYIQLKRWRSGVRIAFDEQNVVLMKRRLEEAIKYLQAKYDKIAVPSSLHSTSATLGT